RRKKQAPSAPRSSLYIFSGKLWCADHDTQIRVIRKHLYNCPDKTCQHRNIKHGLLMSAALKALHHMTEDQIKMAIDGQRHVRSELEAQRAHLTARLENARAAIRNLLETLAERGKSTEILDFLDEKEAEVLKVKFDIDKLDKALAPIAKIPDHEVKDVLESFRNTIAPLYKDEFDQATTAKVHPWFRRFVVRTVDQSLEIEIEYDWPNLLRTLREIETHPFLSRRPA
ncbi:MAG: hypothetical protein HQL35_15555, partial [Alphaproteobacteria bacterium]|nr:hypothetical protein [Alphaproteobacteria bacterium]